MTFAHPRRALLGAIGVGLAAAACGARTALLPGEGQGGASTASSSVSAGSTVTSTTASSTSASSGGTGGGPASVCVLVGGDIDVLAGKTWLWTGDTWSQAMPPVGPSARSNPAIATLDGKVVVFGGYGSVPMGTTYLGDTWIWDGATWTQAQPSPSPPARSNASAATLGDAVVVFGGWGPAPLDDTWTWDGATWTEASPAHSPPSRNSGSMATLNGEAVLFGGESAGDSPPAQELNDTWVWDGTDWTLLSPPASPSPRRGAAVAVVGDRIVLFGGQDDNSKSLGDTWAWDGTTWEELEPPVSPAPRVFAAAATLFGTMVMFGGADFDVSTPGLDDTWLFQGGAWTQWMGTGPDALDSSGAMSCY